jgi:alpha-L-glutamate ligase-like protein
MLSWLKKSKQILGLNSRSLDYIKPGNPRRAIKLVDNKLRTKRVLRKNGLPVCDIIKIIRTRDEYYRFDWESLPKSFVLKPNHGLGGEGIMVTYGRKKNGSWVLPHERSATVEDIKMRASNILDGDFSITGAPDSAFFEERLKIHPVFKPVSYKGIPDVRIIVYNKVPVMAMLRLPTRQSNGKANLHQGGLGLGIDIGNGTTTNAIQYDNTIEKHPDTLMPLRGIKIPFWDQMLEIAINAAAVCGLNYTGVDIALDREKGPMILELNARPGLSIQNANLAPLKDRLIRVRGLKIKTVKKGIKVAKELFGGEIEHEVEGITGKQVLGFINKVKIKKKDGEWLEVPAKLDTGAGISSIDENLAVQLGFEDAVNYYKSFNIKNVLTLDELIELKKRKVRRALKKHPDIVSVVKVFSSHGISYRMEVSVEIELEGKLINSNVSVIMREHLDYPILIGRRDLKDYLIDPAK